MAKVHTSFTQVEVQCYGRHLPGPVNSASTVFSVNEMCGCPDVSDKPPNSPTLPVTRERLLVYQIVVLALLLALQHFEIQLLASCCVYLSQFCRILVLHVQSHSASHAMGPDRAGLPH